MSGSEEEHGNAEKRKRSVTSSQRQVRPRVFADMVKRGVEQVAAAAVDLPEDTQSLLDEIMQVTVDTVTRGMIREWGMTSRASVKQRDIRAYLRKKFALEADQEYLVQVADAAHKAVNSMSSSSSKST